MSETADDGGVREPCPLGFCGYGGWTGSRHDAGRWSGHYHCPCGAPCRVDEAEGCTGFRDPETHEFYPAGATA